LRDAHHEYNTAGFRPRIKSIDWRKEEIPMTLAGIVNVQPARIIGGAWLTLGLYWLVASFSAKAARKRQPMPGRLLYVLYMFIAFSFLYGADRQLGFLDRRFLPDRLWIAQVGAAITVVGVAFAIWARWHIGKNWSAVVSIKKDHELIRTGPYSRIRHPIYTGILLAALGTAITVNEYRGLAALAMVATGFYFKAKREESFLNQEFGASFEEHKRHTGFFLPRFS
jgi:protein-S-isoprenylcysteine O-methyltransferase Ste14